MILDFCTDSASDSAPIDTPFFRPGGARMGVMGAEPRTNNNHPPRRTIVTARDSWKSSRKILAFVGLSWAVVHTGLVLRCRCCSEVKTRRSPGSAGSGDYQLAARQSGGFFTDLPDDQWEVAREIFRSHQNHRYMDRPLTFHPGESNSNASFCLEIGDLTLFSSHRCIRGKF